MPVYTDDFNRADSSSLGANWTWTGTNPFAIENNQVKSTSLVLNAARHAGTITGTGELFSEIAYTGTAEGVALLVGPAVNMPTLGATIVATTDYYLLWPSGTGLGTLTIRRKDSGAAAQTTMGAVVNFQTVLGDILRLETQGTDLVGFSNGVEIIRRAKSLAPLTTGGTGVGFYTSGNAAVRVDDFAGGDVADKITPLTFQAVTATGWTAVGGTALDVVSDELPTTYLRSPDDPSSSVVDLTLRGIETPAGDFVVTLRGDELDSVTSTVVITLQNGGSTVATATLGGALTVVPSNLTATFSAASISGVSQSTWQSGTLVVRATITATP